MAAGQRWGSVLILVFIAASLIGFARRTAPAPKPQEAPPFQFLDAWGDKGNGPGKLDAPVGFAADTLGRIYFADPAAGFVHKFESSGTPLLSFEDSRVRRVSGIAVDSGGAIYTADAQRGNIFIFFPDGSFLRAMHMPSQRHFSGPLGFSLDDLGNLYMPDPAGSRVMKYSGSGRLLKSWKVPKNAPASEERPLAVAATPDGLAFVAYAHTGRIEKYASDGSWSASWNAAGNDAPTADPVTGLAVAGQFVIAASASSPRIRVWTLDGQHKLDDDLGGHLDGVATPQIAVTPDSELLVLDPAAPRVYRFRMHLQF